MMETRYDRAALIQAYIQAHEPYQLHDNFKRFYDERLAALEQAFGLRLSSDGVRNAEYHALWMLFHAAVKSYLSIRTPRSNFLDDTLITVKLDRLGARADAIAAYEARIVQAAESSRAAHLGLLDELFQILWGEIDTVVTSEQLRQIGFDDAEKPKHEDYLDYM
jgi:hypothetical protein